MALRHTILTTLVLTAVGASGTGTAAAASKPDPAGACKDGGFAGYTDPTTSAPFANQGQCVSFVRHGGTLVPYVPTPPPPPVSTATIVNSFAATPAGGAGGLNCMWNVQLTNYPANAVENVDLVFAYDASGPVLIPIQMATDATGSAFSAAALPLNGTSVTASTTDPAASDTDTVRC